MISPPLLPVRGVRVAPLSALPDLETVLHSPLFVREEVCDAAGTPYAFEIVLQPGLWLLLASWVALRVARKAWLEGRR